MRIVNNFLILKEVLKLSKNFICSHIRYNYLVLFVTKVSYSLFKKSFVTSTHIRYILTTLKRYVGSMNFMSHGELFR